MGLCRVPVLLVLCNAVCSAVDGLSLELLTHSTRQISMLRSTLLHCSFFLFSLSCCCTMQSPFYFHHFWCPAHSRKLFVTTTCFVMWHSCPPPVFLDGQAHACMQGLEATNYDTQKLLLAHLQGARIRHRMRQPACKGLCSEILEMYHMVLALGEAHTHTPADSGLQRQLKQHLRVRRWALPPPAPSPPQTSSCICFSFPPTFLGTTHDGRSMPVGQNLV